MVLFVINPTSPSQYIYKLIAYLQTQNGTNQKLLATMFASRKGTITKTNNIKLDPLSQTTNCKNTRKV